MTEGRRVLITGAAGFVGRTLGRRLSLAGFSVSGLDLTLPSNGATEPLGFVRFAPCDLLDDQALQHLPFEHDFDAVVHLAAVLPARVPRGTLFAANVGCTSAVLERFVRPSCQLVLFSTGLVYGAQPGPFHEGLECMPTEPYGQSKLAAEALARAHCRAKGSPLCVLRPSVLYGPGAPTGMLLSSMLETLRKGEPFAMTPGEQLRDFLHVEDVASAVLAILEQRAEGTWNLSSGASCTVRQAAELGATIAKHPELLRIGALPYRQNEVFDYRLDPRELERAVGWLPQIPLSAGLEALWSMNP
jgi:nucleoside-diphosphate-sugar epimerase